MTTQLMMQPSSFIRSGVRMNQLGDVYIFKFTDDLQARFEELLNQNKKDLLTPQERAELDGISELSRIFTLINAQLAAQAKWCPLQLESLSDDEPDVSANIATLPNI
ncbi:hypothetical protein [Dulcicalothrix desertica]|nr:hypothetical protein [Dulcicalothrix desertica]